VHIILQRHERGLYYGLFSAAFLIIFKIKPKTATLLFDSYSSKEEFSNIRSNDKSDRPIIYSAKKHHCILITDDIPTKKDALNYVMTFHSNEAIEVFEIKLAKLKKYKKCCGSRK
jgi:hypothetical protein